MQPHDACNGTETHLLRLVGRKWLFLLIRPFFVEYDMKHVIGKL